MKMATSVSLSAVVWLNKSPLLRLGQSTGSISRVISVQVFCPHTPFTVIHSAVLTRAGIPPDVKLQLLLLWVPEALGHMPFPATTVVDVPLGVVLFYLAVHLAMLAHSTDV